MINFKKFILAALLCSLSINSMASSWLPTTWPKETKESLGLLACVAGLFTSAFLTMGFTEYSKYKQITDPALNPHRTNKGNPFTHKRRAESNFRLAAITGALTLAAAFKLYKISNASSK